MIAWIRLWPLALYVHALIALAGLRGLLIGAALVLAFLAVAGMTGVRFLLRPDDWRRQ